LDPISQEGYDKPGEERRTTMIFRQFLSPTTGCASYLFG